MRNFVGRDRTHAPGTMATVTSPARYAWLSIAAALATMALKLTAFLVTDSVGLLSDALESGVNLAAAVMVLLVLRVATAPPDREHEFGHGKAEYFSSGIEGALILAAAVAIVVSAVPRLVDRRELGELGLGLGLALAATVINLVVARVLLVGARRHRSIGLEADAHHLMTDVWTSVGVLVGIAGVAVTGWSILDPLIAIGVALHILSVGARLVHRSVMGLLDTAVSAADRAQLVEILERWERDAGIRWHALRTRVAGSRRFVSVHVLVPGEWTVQRGHDLCEQIEKELRGTRAQTTVFTHLEPVEDRLSFADEGLDRDDAR